MHSPGFIPQNCHKGKTELMSGVSNTDDQRNMKNCVCPLDTRIIIGAD